LFLVFEMTRDEHVNSRKDFNECFSRTQLQAAMEDVQKGMNDAIKKTVINALIDLKLGSNIERLDRRISTLTDKVIELENHLPNEEDTGGQNIDEDTVLDENGNIDVAATRATRLQCRLRDNRRGMGGHQHQGNTYHALDDPYAKVNLQFHHFWVIMMSVEQKFSAHLVPERHRVRQASSEFKDFAIIWWSGLVAENALPTTWEQLKVAMREHFVPPSYHRDLHKKLMRLEQGDKFVQD
jgi:hypothetical protein